jgi:hypothetical protein
MQRVDGIDKLYFALSLIKVGRWLEAAQELEDETPLQSAVASPLGTCSSYQSASQVHASRPPRVKAERWLPCHDVCVHVDLLTHVYDLQYGGCRNLLD